ncbi:MAG: DegQ family serine endoprotease [Anaeromyxobacter sp.]
MTAATAKRSVPVLAALALFLGGAIYVAGPGSARAQNAGPAQAAPAPAPAPAAPPPAAAAAPAAAPALRALPDFTTIVRQYGAAVVNVSTIGTAEAGRGQGLDDVPPPLRRFMQPPGEQLTRGAGSGFIVSQDGLILTNAHVIRGATEVNVKLTDKREFRAKVVGLDKDTDVAVLRIDARGLPVVKLGDAERLQVGEWVLAIGSPFGFENTVTAGVVSARARSLPGEGYVPFIQTDVAINPGNSGGPLFNLAGEVVGINSQIYSGSGGYMGLSFAIPIDVAMKVQQQLVAHGKVIRGRLGVVIQDVDARLAGAFGLPRPAGALVSNVDPKGPSAKLLRSGDVILSLNGKEIVSSTDLPPRVADIKPGTPARLELWRNGARTTVEVKVSEAPAAAVADAREGEGDKGRLGITVRALTVEEARQLGVDGGALVQGVGGPAARAGIQPGDVVVAVNNTPVESLETLRAVVGKAKDRVALLVQRGDARIFVPVDLN